jgi:endonuclease/exonuclease/phosphatase family metal-dependent hydrolase
VCAPLRFAINKLADTTRVELTVLSWNLFHGRDFPPDPALRTWRSRLLRLEERNATHVQLNRDLTEEFATLLSRAEWDVAMLQECPPRFAEPLALACRAEAHRTLTSRNAFGALRGLLARQNPDLMASGEGGSNLILVRVPGRLGGIAERREMAIHEGEPERRAMGFVRTASGVCVANLHATNDWPKLAEVDVLEAARAALEWAGGSPLVFGGDLNLRPGKQPRVFERLRAEFGLAPTTAPDAIDHILCRGLEVLEPPTRWPAERRELPLAGRALRLSDHAPVQARFLLADPHLLRN